MGNRAVITTKNRDLAVYLHWNGGRDSVAPFLKYAKLHGYRCPEYDIYGWARLCQIIGNFFGGSNSVGIGTYESLKSSADFDNGVYIIENWEIIGREGKRSASEQNSYPFNEFLHEINDRMPESERIDLSAYPIDSEKQN